MVNGSDSLRDQSRPGAGWSRLARPQRLRSQSARLAAFACLYVAFAATLGFLGGAAPIVLRERGASLAAVGLLQLIYLPIGLTFLWAPALDRLRWPVLPHRLGWIAAMQVLGILALLALMVGEGWPAAALFALALAVSVGFATMDVSMEALVVETVAERDRPAVTTAKLAGSSIGGLLGTGLLVVAFHRLGWRGSFLALAMLDALCLLPMLLYPEAASRRFDMPQASAAPARGDLPPTRPLRALFGPALLGSALLGRALLIGLYFGAAAAVGSAYALVLQDLGLSLAAIGLLTGTLGPAINLVGTLAVGALMAGALGRRAVPAERLVVPFAAGAALSGGLLTLGAALAAPRLAAAGVVLGLGASAGLGVPVFNMLYRWSQGDSPAGDYALLFGIGFLAAMPARVGGPALAGALGWPLFFLLGTPVLVGTLLLVARAMRRTAAGERR